MNDWPKEKRPNSRLFVFGPSQSWTIPMVCGVAVQLNRHLPGIFLIASKLPGVSSTYELYDFLVLEFTPYQATLAPFEGESILIFICLSMGTVCSTFYILHCCCCLAQLIFGRCFHVTGFFHWQPPEASNVFIERENQTSRMEASNQSHCFVHEKNMICTLETFFWACDRSRSEVDILVHVPNFQHSRILEYVKKSSETVDIFLKTALFLIFYFFRSELCCSEALQKYASVAASRLRSRKK